MLASVAVVSLAGCGAAEDPPAASGATGDPRRQRRRSAAECDGELPAGIDPGAAEPICLAGRSGRGLSGAGSHRVFSDDVEMMDGSAMAERNLGVINQYGAAHPEVSTRPYLDWSTDPPRVVVGFSGDLAPHRGALQPQLADPERVLICQVSFSDAQLQVFAAEIVQQMSPGGPIGSVGVSRGAVNVMVAEGNDAVVAELVATSAPRCSSNWGRSRRSCRSTSRRRRSRPDRSDQLERHR